MKRCTRCSIKKKLHKFKECEGMSDGHYNWCKLCCSLLSFKCDAFGTLRRKWRWRHWYTNNKKEKIVTVYVKIKEKIDWRISNLRFIRTFYQNRKYFKLIINEEDIGSVKRISIEGKRLVVHVRRDDV